MKEDYIGVLFNPNPNQYHSLNTLPLDFHRPGEYVPDGVTGSLARIHMKLLPRFSGERKHCYAEVKKTYSNRCCQIEPSIPL